MCTLGWKSICCPPGDGIVTDRHHASADRYESDDPTNQIERQISLFTLSGWLRHGCEEVVRLQGATACHPGEPNADYMRAETYERDLESGYHEKGTCLDEHDDGCVVYDLFGGFGAQPGELLRRTVTPIHKNWISWLGRRKRTTGIGSGVVAERGRRWAAATPSGSGRAWER
jgi:hypothetical protein